MNATTNTLTTVFDNNQCGDYRVILERDTAGQLYLTTNADTRRPVGAEMYRAWSCEQIEDIGRGLRAMGCPADVADEYIRQAYIYI